MFDCFCWHFIVSKIQRIFDIFWKKKRAMEKHGFLENHRFVLGKTMVFKVRASEKPTTKLSENMPEISRMSRHVFRLILARKSTENRRKIDEKNGYETSQGKTPKKTKKIPKIMIFVFKVFFVFFLYFVIFWYFFPQ